jgi:hypothetical protein
MSLTYTTFSLYLKRQTSMAVRGVDVLHEDRGLSQESVDRLVSSAAPGSVAVYNDRLGEGGRHPSAHLRTAPVRRTAPTPMQVQEIPAITLKTLSRYPTYSMLLGGWG